MNQKNTIEPDKLYELITTDQDRQDLLDLLNESSESFFKQDEKAENIISANKKYGPALLVLLAKDIENNDPTDALKKISDIKSQIESLPKIQVTLATSPTDSIMSKISEFIKKKTSKKSVLDIKVNPEILGGVILIIDGKYFDMSVARKLNSAFDKSNMQEILNMNQEAS